MSEKSSKKIDIFAIGDVVVDDFIRIKDADIHDHHRVNHTDQELCVRFGDKVPYEFHEVLYAVGNSPNASVCASRLGLASALSATVGKDENGEACYESLKKDGVIERWVETDPKLPTNYHYVLWYGPERTILVNHSPYERHMPKDLPEVKWIYLSSLGANTEAFHKEIASWITAHPETKLAFQPGTFQMLLGIDHLKEIYARTEILSCNVEEAQRILKTGESDKIKLMHMLTELGPKMISLTDGIDGAYAYDGKNAYFMPVYPHEPFERTGAGDAHFSTIVSALALGKTFEEALAWGPINAMSVVQQVGAQKGLLTREKLEEFLTKAPADYKLKKL